MLALNSTRQTLFRGARTLSTSAVRNDLARMQVLGRLAADPELKSTKNGKDYVRYTVATSDPPTGPAEDGERAPTTTSYHRFYVFGDRGVDRMRNIKKGYRVLVDAEFRIERTPAEGEQPARETLLALHRGIQVISKPKEAGEA
ncbi:Primosome PriB/single-strand DNA-binding [Kalmanozyma brasiliensis GHG001]|uniref:Ca2+ transporting ATPase n=1 Tax=Kalmanozyma brasiliensis (strain GHG001) TaxID=1365824 RepID=V5EZ65_KALBG|nr:Primosome PriB/single-strand DNA-binding [Kalmanozyma brasiliensis GHG001]EST09163.1 Primosome PriB/single-strand DNA-binding [Kalmanozyma brasiliensis GHG001]